MAWAKALSDISVKVGSDGSRNVGGAAMDRENGGSTSRYNNNNNSGIYNISITFLTSTNNKCYLLIKI